MPRVELSLLSQLKALEVELHQPLARSDGARLDALLHDDFREFGRSGADYTKASIQSQLLAASEHATVVADRFEVTSLGDAVALLTYRSAHRLADGTLGRFTLRSSTWVHSPTGWQMRFHQGTPTAPYEPEASPPLVD